MSELIDDYKNVARTLFSKQQKVEVSPLANALRKAVNESGPNIYRDGETLASALRANNISETDIFQVCLLAVGSSLKQYLDQLESGLNPIEINNIVLTAIQAGLSYQTAYQITSDVLYSLHVPQINFEIEMPDQDVESQRKRDLYIPPVVYRKGLMDIGESIQKAGALDSEQFTLLNTYAKAGIPFAHSLLGYLYLRGLGVPKDEKKALEYLEYAASYGDAEALGLMGDYYYAKDNQKAYQLYSFPGSIGLDIARRNKFRNLDRSQDFHKTQLKYVALLVLLCELCLASMLIISGSSLTAVIVGTVFNLLVFLFTILIHVKNPFQDLRYYAIPLLVITFLCICL